MGVRDRPEETKVADAVIRALDVTYTLGKAPVAQT
jgi:hypothetical protein